MVGASGWRAADRPRYGTRNRTTISAVGIYRPASGPGRSGSRARDWAPDGSGLVEIRASAIWAYLPATDPAPRAGRPVGRIPRVARNAGNSRLSEKSAGTGGLPPAPGLPRP